jgi:hypothetical protein
MSLTWRSIHAWPYTAVVSSALVACEIPPWRDYNNVAVTTTVSLYTHGRGAQSTHQPSSAAAAAAAAAADFTSIGSTPTSHSPLSAAAAAASATAAGADAGRPGATLWMEYLPSGRAINSEYLLTVYRCTVAHSPHPSLLAWPLAWIAVYPSVPLYWYTLAVSSFLA